MANHENIPTTDTAQIERLIERLEQGKLEQGDAQLIGKLLSFLLSLITIVQSPKMTLRRLKKLIFDLKKRDSKKLFVKLCGRQSPEHQARHREINQRLAGRSLAFVIFAQAPTEVQPRECALDNPTARQQR